MIIKCKMCGGDIDFIPGATYGTCEYCGSTSTIPQAEDENKLNRYNRANHFRRQCEFDKAVAAYEKILEQDDTDAEAHWGAVISRFGIEYVEDPATHQRIPTCHRVQVASILTDEDYLAAVENAPDEESRRIYQEEAARIAEIQKGILAISANEKPYDVFICYKETDENGQRTRDSQWAQDVYYGLTEQGLKVFFSRITLEDKLGQQYEPYIFAALNSAKVMVVIGSRPEYFNAVWVKNEWSRYLSLMKHDHKRLLIPCYRDMDPYDLPEELSMLQSQDMSKIGFMQDLLRGVQKVMQQPTSAPQVVRVETATVETNAPGVTSLLKRAALFLEDGDTASAREYYDRVLDIDPECAEAYMGKVCAETGCRKESDLGTLNYCVDMRGDWQKAVRFASAAQKQTYTGYMASVRARVEEHCQELAIDCACAVAAGDAERCEMERVQEAYQKNCLMLGNENTDYESTPNMSWHLSQYQAKRAKFKKMHGLINIACISVSDLKNGAEMFQKIKGQEENTKSCLEMAEKIQNEAYDKAKQEWETAKENSFDWERVCEKLNVQQLNGYRDVNELRQKAEQHYTELREKEKQKQALKEKHHNIIIGSSVFIVLITIFTVFYIVPVVKYHRAISLAEAGQYDKAIAIFVSLGEYRDTKQQVKETYYAKGEAEFSAGNWDNAVTAFSNAGRYSDAPIRAREASDEKKYQQAVSMRENGQYEEAIEAFSALGNYSDATEQISETWYQKAMALRQNGQYEDANTIFWSLENYNDAKTQVKETKYQQADDLTNSGEYDEAYAIYATIIDYKDVDNILTNNKNLAEVAAAVALDEKFAVGNYVTLGRYPQMQSGEDLTSIEWLVLARDKNKALLISQYGLDAQPYNESETNVTWEKCSLRAWLNDVFFSRAFDTSEQQAIILTTVANDKSQGYSEWNITGGSTTKDKVFLLSYAEAKMYFGLNENSNTKSCIQPTAYAIAQGVFVDGASASWWWLRSPGHEQYDAARVGADGSLYYHDVRDSSGAVRPAIWVDLDSPFFQ